LLRAEINLSRNRICQTAQNSSSQNARNKKKRKVRVKKNISETGA